MHCWQSHKHCTLTAAGREEKGEEKKTHSHINIVRGLYRATSFPDHTVSFPYHPKGVAPFSYSPSTPTSIEANYYSNIPILGREGSSLDW